MKMYIYTYVNWIDACSYAYIYDYNYHFTHACAYTNKSGCPGLTTSYQTKKKHTFHQQSSM